MAEEFVEQEVSEELPEEQIEFTDNSQADEAVQAGQPADQEPRSKKLWQSIVDRKLYSKSYDEFKQQFSNPESRNRLHSSLQGRKLYSKDLASFNSQFFGEAAPEQKPAQQAATAQTPAAQVTEKTTVQEQQVPGKPATAKEEFAAQVTEQADVEEKAVPGKPKAGEVTVKIEAPKVQTALPPKPKTIALNYSGIKAYENSAKKWKTAEDIDRGGGTPIQIGENIIAEGKVMGGTPGIYKGVEIFAEQVAIALGAEKFAESVGIMKKKKEGPSELTTSLNNQANQSRNAIKTDIGRVTDYAKTYYKDFVGKTVDGFETLDPKKIKAFVDKMATGAGVSPNGYFSNLLYTEMKGAVSSAILVPQVEKEFNTRFEKKYGKSVPEYMKEKGEEVISNFDLKEGVKLKNELKTKVSILEGTIKKDVQLKLDVLSAKVESDASKFREQSQIAQDNFNNTFSKFIVDGKFTGTPEEFELYKQEYGKINELITNNNSEIDKLAENFLKQQNFLNTKANARFRRQVEELEDITNEQYNKKLKEYSGTVSKIPGLQKEIEQLYTESYNNVLNKNNDLKVLVTRGKGNPILTHAENLLSSIGGAIRGYSASLDYNPGIVLGDFLEGKFDVGKDETKKFTDLFDPQKFAALTGNLVGSFVLPMIPAATATAVTRGAGGGVLLQSLVGASVSWFGESADMAGRIKQDTFERTGDLAKAENAANQTWDAQKSNWYLYALDGLPFVKGAFSKIKGKVPSILGGRATRVVLGGLAEYGTELAQEYKQGLQEEAIRETGDYRNAFLYHSMEKFQNTALQVAPTFGMGAIGPLMEKTDEEKVAELAKRQAESFALKSKFSELAPNQRKQFLFDMMQRQGINFTSSYLLASFTNGDITQDVLDEMNGIMNQAGNIIEKTQKIGLTPADQKVYSAFQFEYDNAKKAFEEEEDETIKQVLGNRMMSIQNELNNFAQNKKANYVVLAYPNNEQYVLTYDEANKMMGDVSFANALRQGKVQMQSFGEAREMQNKIEEVKAQKVQDEIIGGSVYMQAPMVIPELQTEQALSTTETQQQYDTQNESGVSSQVGVGQEPVQTQPVQEAGGEATTAGGVLQAPQPGREGQTAGGEQVIEVKLPEIEVVTEETPTAAEPKENDTVELDPQIKGGIPRTMVFKEGKWQQQVGGTVTGVSPAVQQQAQQKFSQSAQAVPAAPTQQMQQQKAEQPTTATQQTQQAPTQQAPETMEGTKVFTQDSIDQIDVSELPAEKRKVVKKVAKDIKRVYASIAKLVKASTGQDLKIYAHANQETYAKAVTEAGGTKNDVATKGFYLDKNGNIHLNLNKVTSETMLHEGFHPVLDYMAKVDEGVINSLFDQLNSFEEGKQFIARAKRNYSGDVTQKKEAITDFIAQVADGTIVLNPTNLQAIKKFILDTLSKLGFDVKSFEGIKVQNAQELVDLARNITEKFAAGEEITIEDVKGINEADVQNGDVVATAKVPENIKADESNDIQYSKDIDEKLERVGIMDDVKRGNLSSISGQYMTTTMSDKATVGKVKYKSLSYDKQGGILYPLLMKKLGLNRVWASLGKGKMESLVDALKVNEDGYSYIGIMAMGKTSHMSNIDAFNLTFDIIENELKDRKSGLTKEILINEINQAYQKKYKTGKSIESVVGKPNLNTKMTIPQIKNAVLENISNNESAFELRRSFLESLLGKAEKKESRLRTVPNYNEVAAMMEEPLIANVGNGDVVAYMRVKKEDLKVIKTSPEEVGHHKSYEYAVESSSPIEYVLLNNPVHVSEIYPEFINKSGNKVSFEEAKAKYGEEKARRTHARNVTLSSPSEQVPQFSKEDEKINEKDITSQYESEKAKRKPKSGDVKINSEKVQYNGTDAIGSRERAESDKTASRKRAKEKIKNPSTNASLKAANQYNESVGLPEVESHEYKPSDAVQQTKIAKVYPQLQDVNSPTYKETELERSIYSKYKAKYPKIFKDFDIKNYKDLVKKSYAQLIAETELQYEALPVKVTFHENGEGNYENNFEMLDDVHNFNHLWVYKGGEDHTELGSKTTDADGLTANDKFRAVHDYYGHSVEGYQFGKDGEENAWIEHSKMFSPLAQWALSAETRGQNSWVNYSGVNATVLETIKTGAALKKEGLKTNNQEMIDEGNKLLDTVYDNFQFAEQKAIVLPPEYADVSKFHKTTISEVPSQLQNASKPQFSREEEVPKTLNELGTEAKETIKYNYQDSSGLNDFDWNKESKRENFREWLNSFEEKQFNKNLPKVIKEVKEDIELLKQKELSDAKLRDFEDLIIPSLGNEALVPILSKFEEDILLDPYLTLEEMEAGYREAKNIIDEDGSLNMRKIETGEILNKEKRISLPGFERFVKENPDYQGVFDAWKKIFDEDIQLTLKETNAYRYPSIKELENLYSELTGGETSKPQFSREEKVEGTLDGKPATFVKLPENVEVVNGFYSPIEKRLAETKIEKQSANKWKEVVGKGDEAKFTGVLGWLESLPPTQQVSKSEIQNWMKDNRIEINEIVLPKEKEIKERVNIELELPGERTDYKEVLVTTPVKVEYPKENYTIKSRREYLTDKSNYTAEDKGDYFMVTGKRGEQNQIEKSYSVKTKEDAIEAYIADSLEFGLDENTYDFYDENGKYFNTNFGETEEMAKRNYNFSNKKEKDSFKSSHYDEPNILAHIRMNTRVDANGNKVLHIEEFQSDYGQKARKKGFILSEKEKQKLRDERRVNKERRLTILDEIKDAFNKDNYDKVKELNEEDSKLNKRAEEIGNLINKEGVPEAPFVEKTADWTKLAWKVALKEAVKQGADKITWTTGEQQSERYDLRKQVDEVLWKKNQDGTYAVSANKNGDTISKDSKVTPEKLAEEIGKDAVDKIMSSTEDNGVLEGDDLAVGGKGMKGFYGSPAEGKLGIVGEVAKSLFKQEPSTTELKEGTIQNSIDVTPEMKAQVEGGLPQFSREEEADSYPEAPVSPSEDIFKEAFSLRMAERNQLFYDNFGVNGDKAKKIYGDWLKIKGRMQDAASKNLLDIKFINC